MDSYTYRGDYLAEFDDRDRAQVTSLFCFSFEWRDAELFAVAVREA